MNNEPAKHCVRMRLTAYMSDMLDDAVEEMKMLRHEFMMPEHLLLAMAQRHAFCMAMQEFEADADTMRNELNEWLGQQEKVPDDVVIGMRYSTLFNVMIINACNTAEESGEAEVNVCHFVKAMCELKNSEASYLLHKHMGGRLPELLDALEDYYPNLNNGSNDGFDSAEGNADADGYESAEAPKDWHKLVTCISDKVDSHNPLIGREMELDRTIQVLCRAEKNNPLHIGEPGVGKTALVYGLASLINNGDVPERLRGARIYSMDIGQMLAGAKYRGDFEKRVKMVMDGAAEEDFAIIYIDEIHNVVGAGTTTDGGPDASNILKPYLEDGRIRFIGSTTYDEYNRRMAQSRGFVRRFQQIDIKEPSEEEAVKILGGLKARYADYHGVAYTDEAVEYAVHASAKHISNRCLPDKAIDLIDEAGAYVEVHHAADDGVPCVTKAVVQQVLAKVCRIDAAAMKDDGDDALMTLHERVLGQIYGQNDAVDKVVEAVMMAKAGLVDDDKPMASLLFVGPTGVGKTEVARVLAKELGVELVRFDMSEYVEKHAVAKLIGSPAGYVGYEDGGLLTDAIRKTPNCVLLLDEIEKAHDDIYNILLQVMDYARLTDNKGQKADFRNVILIMTSNAGAQFASQANVGFSSRMSRGGAMLEQVKKTFKPEFINRLSDTVVFNDMDEQMAELILDKKLQQLVGKLAAKAVILKLTDAARVQLLKWGFTREYGAREMDRVIARRLKPLLVKALLFGSLKDGGTAVVDYDGRDLVLS